MKKAFFKNKDIDSAYILIDALLSIIIISFFLLGISGFFSSTTARLERNRTILSKNYSEDTTKGYQRIYFSNDQI